MDNILKQIKQLAQSKRLKCVIIQMHNTLFLTLLVLLLSCNLKSRNNNQEKTHNGRRLNISIPRPSGQFDKDGNFIPTFSKYDIFAPDELIEGSNATIEEKAKVWKEMQSQSRSSSTNDTYQEGYDEGYDEGYEEGKGDGYEEGKKALDD